MRSKNIQKNIQLMSEFDEYMWEKPERWNKLPYGSNLVMTDDADPDFNKFTRKIAKAAGRKDFTFVEIKKVDADWTISPISL